MVKKKKPEKPKSDVPMKGCSSCLNVGRDYWHPLSAFNKNASNVDGLSSQCRLCSMENKRIARENRAAQRIASDFEALKPEDFDVSVGNVPDRGGGDAKERAQAAAEKRQEYNRKMGEVAQGLRNAALSAKTADEVADNMPPELGSYIGNLAEQEARWGNRRLARSVSLQLAADALAIRRFKDAAKEWLSGKVVPAGYANNKKAREKGKVDRATVVQFTDLHLGANLSGLSDPTTFDRVEEARRLEFVVRQAIEYKSAYRDRTKLVVILNGDVIQGQLGHDWRDGAPLTEQYVIFWKLFSQVIGIFAREFKQVLVVCQPGNHGRDVVRHPGRALREKWDGHEWRLYFGLREMCSALPNVEWDLQYQAVSIINLFGRNLLCTHGDTEIKIGAPYKQHEANLAQLDKINSTNLYGCQIDGAAFGHFHTPMHVPGTPDVIYGGMLVPPDSYARSQGHIRNSCGLWIWEAVENYVIGDSRFVKLDETQDNDESLGVLIKPAEFGA